MKTGYFNISGFVIMLAILVKGTVNMSRQSQSGIASHLQVRRHPERASTDRETIIAILDAMPVCTIGYVIDGQPFVTPTLQWREGDHIYWHGSASSRMLNAVDGQPVCVTVTILDGLVLTRSVFHHSANFRSVMLFGTASVVHDFDKKVAHFKTFIDGLFPGRWDELRPLTDKEVDATLLLRLPIDQAIAKIRTGPPKDAPKDVGHPVWAGVVPVHIQTGEPVTGPDVPDHLLPGQSVRDFSIG